MRERRQNIRANGVCQVKKMHNPEVENYIGFGRFSEDLSPEDSFSDSCERLLRRGKAGGRIYKSLTKIRHKKQASSVQ